MRIENKRVGFSSLEMVLSIALVGAACLIIGYMVHAKTTHTPISYSESKPAALPGESSEDMIGYLTIKEWGVRIKPAKSLPGLTYTLDTKDTHDWAVLDFEVMPEECAGVWHFSRAQAGQDIDGYGNTAAMLAAKAPETIKKVGKYYYYLGHGQSGCGKETALQAAVITELRGDQNTYQVEALPAAY